MKILWNLLLLALLITPAAAQPPDARIPELDEPTLKIKPIEVKVEVLPKPFVISHNIVFLIDASSSIYNEPALQRKFERAWGIITSNFASDELYFKIYVFNDKNKERMSKWYDAGGPLGLKKFRQAKKWILKKTGIYSWGLQAFKMALREKCPLDNNRITARRLTVVVMTDGGFTEAAEWVHPVKKIQKATEDRAIGGAYVKTGSFKVFDRMIAQEQVKRKKKGLSPAVIVTIGIENDNPTWGLTAKQPNDKCQAWLKKIGTQYHGGYLYVRNKPVKIKKMPKKAKK